MNYNEYLEKQEYDINNTFVNNLMDHELQSQLFRNFYNLSSFKETTKQRKKHLKNELKKM